jgi:phospholipase C
MKRTTAAAASLLLALGCAQGAVHAVDDGGVLPDSEGDAGAGSDAGLPDSGAPDAGASGGDGGYPITHVIVIVKENHTFDNYFGSFPGAEGTSTYRLSDGGTGACGRAPQNLLRDLDHGHGDGAGLTDWNDGGMNGWDRVPRTSVNGDNLAYAQYLEEDIPNYWAYARTFTLGDHFFSEMIGPSFPGHTILLAAQAAWALDNPDITSPYWGCDQPAFTRVTVENQTTCRQERVFPCFDIPSLPDVLPRGVTWKFYGSNFYLLPEVWSMFDAVRSIRSGPGWANVVHASQFDKDIDNHELPNVSWLVSQDLADEHPRVGSPCLGENWTVEKINKLMQSEYWQSTAILFTMDDFGGWYDHLPPPRQYGCDPRRPYGLGFRLPLILISPYAKPHFVFREVAEHASILRFIEKIFGSAHTLTDLDPAAQDEKANDLMHAFDFTQQPLPPLLLSTRACL